MKEEEEVTDALLRQFLLGKVDDEQRERIETLFITDSQARERVLAAEQDLIEDFLENGLTSSDRERFLSQYAQTAAQQRKLRITKSIKDFALTQAAATQLRPSSTSRWSHLRAWLRPMFVVPIASAIIVAIVVLGIWLATKIEQRNRHLAMEQELARLNSPGNLREVPPQTVLLELSPVTVRTAEGQNEVKKGRDVRFVDLRLPWIRKERYSTYDARVRRVDGDESFNVPTVQAEDNDGNVIRIRLPADILRKGLYRVELSGVAADGSRSGVEEYNFTVSD